MKIIFTTLCFFILSGTISSQKHELIKLWETDSVFKVPESVLYDQDNNVLYVANIDGTQPWEKDGKGSVGKLGTDGKPVQVEWVKGLNGPKGMGIFNKQLYVADITRVVVIDIASGTISKEIEVPGSQTLNDISIDKKGIVYVSDSRGRKVYRIVNGQPELFLDSLKGPNGVLVHQDDFYLLDAGGLYKLSPDKSLMKIADGMEGGTDGVEHVTGNDFIVSCWQGVVWYVSGDGHKELLLDTRDQKKNSADIGYDASRRIVYVPTFWRNTVVAYQLK